MRKEINIFLTAVMFYTRINVSRWVKYKPEHLNASGRYFPLVGWIVGGGIGIFFYLSSLILGDISSMILSILAGILITGAFHEDGLADTCDGFGGGWNKADILRIMKDSRVGTYGAVGLIFLFLLKIAVMVQLKITVGEVTSLLLLIISAHAISRFVALTFVFTHDYARDETDSKTKPVAEKINAPHLMIAGFFGLAPFVLFVFIERQYLFLLLPILLYLCKILLGHYFKKWIGGYTGDTLGATQQIIEMLFFIGILIAWKFT